jgi:hypothetical protein
MPKTVLCHKLEGGTVEVPATRLIFKPIAFAVVTCNRQLLVTRLPNGELELPGRSLKPADDTPKSVARQVRRLTGMKIQLNTVPFHCHERFIYRLNRGWHSHCFYYHAWLLTPVKRTRRGPTIPPELKPGYSWWPVSRQQLGQLDDGASRALSRYIAGGQLV